MYRSIVSCKKKIVTKNSDLFVPSERRNIPFILSSLFTEYIHRSHVKFQSSSSSSSRPVPDKTVNKPKPLNITLPQPPPPPRSNSTPSSSSPSSSSSSTNANTKLNSSGTAPVTNNVFTIAKDWGIKQSPTGGTPIPLQMAKSSSGSIPLAKNINVSKSSVLSSVPTSSPSSSSSRNPLPGTINVPSGSSSLLREKTASMNNRPSTNNNASSSSSPLTIGGIDFRSLAKEANNNRLRGTSGSIQALRPTGGSSSSTGNSTNGSSHSSHTINSLFRENQTGNNESSSSSINMFTDPSKYQSLSSSSTAFNDNSTTVKRGTLVSARASSFSPSPFDTLENVSTGGRQRNTGNINRKLPSNAGGGAIPTSKQRNAFGRRQSQLLYRKNAAMQKLTRGREIAKSRVVIIRDDITPRTLAGLMGTKIARILSKLSELGETTAIDSPLDPDIAEIIALDNDMEVKRLDGKLRDRTRTVPPSIEEMIKQNYPERPPIVTVMGHVDHGKTSLLDALRGTKVAEGEAGGITQGIAAFSVAMRADVSQGTGEVRAPGGKAPKENTGKNGKKNSHNNGTIVTDPNVTVNNEDSASTTPSKVTAASSVDVMTFIDTPGHALFSAMRKRGSSVTDVVVLVVDGKDGVMPQTLECVKLITEAGLPTVVAATKCDVIDPQSACDRVAKQLLEAGFPTEAYGGDTPIIPVSARTGIGLSNLKEAIALQAELAGLRANIQAPGEAVVMDSRIIKGQGAVVDSIVVWGTLKVGDIVIAGTETGKIKAIYTDAVGAQSFNQRFIQNNGIPINPSSVSSDKKKYSSSSSSSTKDKNNKSSSSSSNEGTMDEKNGNGFAVQSIKEATPGLPVRIIGLKDCPLAGVELLTVPDEETAKAVIEGRKRRAQAAELLRVAAADSVARDADRAAYKQRRQRKTAYELALKRDRRRRAITKSGQDIPADLLLQPWEIAILQEGRDGKVSGVSNTGKRQRQQGGQQNNVTMDFATADSVASGQVSGESITNSDGSSTGETLTPPKVVAFMVRADSQGSLAAIQEAFVRITEQCSKVRITPRIVFTGVGEVTEKDIENAEIMKAQLIAFNSRVSSAVQKLADRKKLPITTGKVIYHILDKICEQLGEHMPPLLNEETTAVAEVKAVFDLNSVKKGDPDRVAGCVITEGILTKQANKYRIVRQEKIIHEGDSLSSLRIVKESVESVSKGKDCGLSVEGYRDYTVGDKIIAIKIQKKKQKLDVTFG